MKSFVLALALGLPTVAWAGEPVGLEIWRDNHPEASQALGDWVKAHPAAAHRFFEWDGHHPLKSKKFVTWTILHPRQTIDVFAAEHPHWPLFDVIMESHRPAAVAFMAWCRTHPRAAEALMNHPRGLEWAGNHLYREYWKLENPR